MEEISKTKVIKAHLQIFFFSAVILAACSHNQVYVPYHENPKQVFQHGGLSHGIGESLLDSPLLSDSLNALLILACRQGLGDLELSRFSSDRNEVDHRIDILMEAGLLVKTRGQYFSSFPILLEQDHTMYAGLIKKAVDKIYPQFIHRLDKLLEHIEQRQWEAWSYHIIWSLIFDSQFIWYELTERHLVPALTTSVEWVIYPPHHFKTGTNYYPDTELKDHWVVVSWSPGGSNTLGILGGRWDPIYRLAINGIDGLNGPEIELLRQMKLINAEQEVSFPVIQLEDSFYFDLKNLAEIYVQFIQDVLPVQEFQPIIRSDLKMCRVIAYHDVSWDVLRRLVADGLIQRPLPLEVGTLSAQDNLAGVCSVVAIYQPFIDQIMKAFEEQ